MKTTVIYHRADFDGIFCREIAKKFLPGAELIGWDYGDPVPKIHGPEPCDPVLLYMLDISIPELMNHPNLIWIDHHKSAIEKFARKDGKPWAKGGIQMDGVAACRLVWQYFALPKGNFIPNKQDFIDRKVTEPLAVRLAGEYDIWDKRDPNAELFQHGLRSQELRTIHWEVLLSGDEIFVDKLLMQGSSIQYAQTRQNESVIKAIGFTFQWEGLTFLGCNASRYNSHLFTAGLTAEHDGCFGFKWTGKEWSVSLYGVPGKPDIDLSKIAVKYGGGGHKQACGFRTSQLPFLNGDRQDAGPTQ